MAMTQSASSATTARFPYAAAFKDPVIDVETIRRATVSRDPYTHMLVDNVLNAEAVPALRAEFPNITKPGFLTVDEVELHGKFKQLIDEPEKTELSEVMSQRMGIDLHPYRRLTTIRKISQAKDGRSHTDGTAKVMTLLVYMNDAWQDDGAAACACFMARTASSPISSSAADHGHHVRLPARRQFLARPPAPRGRTPRGAGRLGEGRGRGRPPEEAQLHGAILQGHFRPVSRSRAAPRADRGRRALLSGTSERPASALEERVKARASRSIVLFFPRVPILEKSSHLDASCSN